MAPVGRGCRLVGPISLERSTKALRSLVLVSQNFLKKESFRREIERKGKVKFDFVILRQNVNRKQNDRGSPPSKG